MLLSMSHAIPAFAGMTGTGTLAGTTVARALAGMTAAGMT